MPSRGIQIFKRIDSDESKTKLSEQKPFFGRSEFIYAFFSFLLSRVILFGHATPFGIALFAASFQKEKIIFGAIGVLAGCISAGAGVHTIQYLLAVGLICLFKLLVDKNNVYDNKRMAAVAAGANFVGALSVLAFEQFLLYGLLTAMIESVILYVSTILLLQVGALQSADYARILIVRREEMLGTILFLALCVCGVPDMFSVGNISLREVLWSLLLLSFAYVGGVEAGVCAGALIGLVSSMAQSEALAVVGLYAACGLSAGLAHRYGKFCISACCLLCAIGIGAQNTVFVFGQVGLVNLMVASVLFLLIPRKFFEVYFAFETDGFTPVQQRSYSARINALVKEKFKQLEQAFVALSDTVDRLSQSKTSQFRLRHEKIVTEAFSKNCEHCSMKVYCTEKEEELTLINMDRAAHRLKFNGRMDAVDFDERFRKRCIHPDAIAETMNQSYALHRLNAVWDGQLNDTRMVLAHQYRDFAGIMQTLSNEITQKVVFENASGTKITRMFEDCGYPITEVHLYEREDESYDAELIFESFSDAFSISEVEEIVSRGMEQHMRVAALDEYSCHVRLEPLYNYIVSSSIAMVKKDGEEKSGDNYAVFNIRNNRCILLLSDGMGSGKHASDESKSAVSLIRNLLTIGFEVDAAVRLVNSALVLKSGQESFATIDMVVIDLLAGEAEFIKIGAASSYIKQKTAVTVVPGSGLPIGILSDTDIYNQSYTLRDGDCIIMASDGIVDGRKKENITEYIDGLTGQDNAQLAKELLYRSLKNGGDKVVDDATVIVAKIVENQQRDFV